MQRIHTFILFFLFSYSTCRADVIFRAGNHTAVALLDRQIDPVVETAFHILKHDFQAVFDASLKKSEAAKIHIGTIGQFHDVQLKLRSAAVAYLKAHHEAFVMQVSGNELYIIGSDKRGTAYGIMELSRLIGVSPWEWWADAKIERRKSVRLASGFYRAKHPSVKYRGIFLNDEDWGLTPWSYLTHEPSAVKGQIGPKTHARIFELLLRLRANSFWPAMHECSVAFYLTPGNREMADKYGIFVGSSHCEPMARNTNAEWKIAGKGTYDYVNNKQQVLQFWEERVRELAKSDNIYTLGIRGVHDSKMLGAHTLQEQKEALTDVLADQRAMLGRLVNPDVRAVPQVFIPYKEVLDVYQMGLQVPDDVTLLWCDDNYGYIRHFPDDRERLRSGGNGIYYHISYWGRPHDYLWLASNHPAQLYTQMKTAYEKGARDMWILNVGDIKPAEYLTELFLDMAWDIDGIENNTAGLDRHLQDWLKREFGAQHASDLLMVMQEYYRLAYIRKPEFMGNTRTEEKDPKYKLVTDLPWSFEEIQQRISDYHRIVDRVHSLEKYIPKKKRDAWFQLIAYPVICAAEMNNKHLFAQLARHGLGDYAASIAAHEHIVELTNTYNFLANGKWRHIMHANPRDLTVFRPVDTLIVAQELPAMKTAISIWNGIDYASFSGEKPLAHGLGYERGAVSIPKGTQVNYLFQAGSQDSVLVRVALAPNHPVAGKALRYAIAINDGEAQIVSFETEGRSEEWKENVLNNRATRQTRFALGRKGQIKISITALDEGVLLDQMMVYELK